jgi:checkpoint serine/threonine-protein kinase
VTINPRNGRNEHVFVNLEALYPAPGTNGPELCFEELMAGHRGWLDKIWKPENSQVATTSPGSGEVDIDIENVSREFSGKLTIARDPVMLDENGVAKEHSREGKGRRMKIKEVNETQISKYSCQDRTMKKLADSK